MHYIKFTGKEQTSLPARVLKERLRIPMNSYELSRVTVAYSELIIIVTNSYESHIITVHYYSPEALGPLAARASRRPTPAARGELWLEEPTESRAQLSTLQRAPMREARYRLLQLRRILVNSLEFS